MGLETPLALLGLLAAALPWLAHRIRRRDLVPRPLPTFELLRRGEAKKRRSSGLTDTLLLLLRIAIVTAASLVLTAPFATARLTFGDGGIASAAIVIDDSLSMSRTETRGPLLRQARARAEQALSSLPRGSEITIVGAGEPPRVLLRRTTDLGAARLLLSNLPESSVRANALPGAISLAATQLDGAKHPTRRMLVLSDFATHTGLRPEDVQLDGVGVQLERVGGATSATNVRFASVRALPDPTTPGKASVSIELQAFGEAPQRIPVSVKSAGREVGRVEIAISGGRGQGTLHVPLPAPGADPTALLHIEALDALDADDTAGVLLRATDAVTVLLVNGDPQPASDRDELHYAARALRLTQDTRGSMLVRSVDATALADVTISHADVIVLANVEAPDAAAARRLIEFVTQGGGLVIAAGDRIDPRRYQAVLGELLPCRIRARAVGREVGLQAPVASRLLPQGGAGLAQVKSSGRLMLECKDAEVPLRFEDAAPMVALGARGRGRTALLATTLDTDWSDLPLRPGYLPLLSQLVRGAANAEAPSRSKVAAGSRVTLAVPPQAVRLEVLAPDGARRSFDDLSGKATVELTETALAGPYRVLAAGADGTLADVSRGAFVAELPAAESDATPLANVEQWPARGTAGSARSVVRNPLRGFVAWAFALLVLVEGVLRLPPRRR